MLISDFVGGYGLLAKELIDVRIIYATSVVRNKQATSEVVSQLPFEGMTYGHD